MDIRKYKFNSAFTLQKSSLMMDLTQIVYLRLAGPSTFKSTVAFAIFITSADELPSPIFRSRCVRVHKVTTVEEADALLKQYEKIDFSNLDYINRVLSRSKSFSMEEKIKILKENFDMAFNNLPNVMIKPTIPRLI